jgi:hypothetical protein
MKASTEIKDHEGSVVKNLVVFILPSSGFLRSAVFWFYTNVSEELTEKVEHFYAEDGVSVILRKLGVQPEDCTE